MGEYFVMSLTEKRAKRTRGHFARTFLGDRSVQEENVRSGFRLHSRIALSEASLLFVFFIKSAREIGG